MAIITKELLDEAAAGGTLPDRFLRTVAAHPDQVALRARAGECDGGRNTRDVLGCVGYGSDRRRGGRVRNNSVNGATRTMRLKLVV